MHQRAALGTRENSLVNGFRKLFLAKDHAASGTPEGLMSSGGYKVGMFYRIGMDTRGYQAGNVSHIYHEVSATGVGNLTETLEINDSRISAGAADNHFWFHFHGLFHYLVIINTMGNRIHAVGNKMIIFAGKVNRGTVGQMARCV